ncbi:hypothetical protein PR048_023813 [Dryococelus australis]|uniref:Endonuclease/exonuclease/phosphatase domain-containing protein n=1 Tax=Dryococelus australis TaxID=614101 RepID=A0ABQ9GV57_9NEOP|nr:hypothetical protein PR048_023813 [Dryococelus australis]
MRRECNYFAIIFDWQHREFSYIAAQYEHNPDDLLRSSGSFVVFIGQDKNVANPIPIGILLFNIVEEIVEILRVGSNSLKVLLKTSAAAKALVSSSKFSEHMLKAYIPTSLVQKQGLVYGILLDVSKEDLVRGIESPFQIKSIQHMNKKFVEKGQALTKYPIVINCCPRCDEDHTLTDCSAPVYCCPNCSGPHSAMDGDHSEMWTLESDMKCLMAMNNLTYHQDKLQLSSASHPKERHDTVFRHAIQQPTDPALSTATSNVGFSSAKTFSVVLNSPRKRLLSEATSGPRQNKLRPIQNDIKILQGLLRTTPTKLSRQWLSTVFNFILSRHSQSMVIFAVIMVVWITRTLHQAPATLHQLLRLLLISLFLQHKMNILQWNCRSRTQQKEHLQHYVMARNIDVIILQERHLHFDHRRAVISCYRFYGNASPYIHRGLYRNTFPLHRCPLILLIPKLSLLVVWFTWDDSIIDRAGAQLANSVLNSRFSVLNMGQHTFMCTYERRSTAIDLTISSSTIVLYFYWGNDTDPLGSDHFPIFIHLLPKMVNYSVSLPVNPSPCRPQQGRLAVSFDILNAPGGMISVPFIILCSKQLFATIAIPALRITFYIICTSMPNSSELRGRSNGTADDIFAPLSPNIHHLINDREVLTGSRHLMSDITDDELLSSLRHSSSAPGIYGITYRHLQEMPFLGKIPSLGKLRLVVPFKKANKVVCEPETFRPITLMSSLEKIFERILKLRLELWLEVNSLLHPDQFGFRKGWSTVDAIAT